MRKVEKFNYGLCPACRRVLRRKAPVGFATCDNGHKLVEVMLFPADVFSELTAQAKHLNPVVSLEQLYSVALHLGLRKIKKMSVKDVLAFLKKQKSHRPGRKPYGQRLPVYAGRTA